MSEVGRVAAIWRYPVKSMRGESLQEADVYWHGVQGDRRFAFVRPGLERSDFPWLTIRENPAMWGYVPRLLQPERPDRSDAVVTTPAGRELRVEDPALASELGDGVRLIKQNRGVFDTAPLSVMGARTVESMGGWDARRFRPNLVIEADEPFAEEGWVGHLLTIGGMQMRVDRRDERCVMVNVNPDTGEPDLPILKQLGRERDACLGVYGTTVAPGIVRVGDPVSLPSVAG